MIWEFSDGTTVELGGKVEGPSALARELREGLATGQARVRIWPPPCEPHEVDGRDAALLDAWLHHKLDLWRRIDRIDVRLKRPEGVPPLPPPPYGAGVEVDPGVAY